MPRVRILGENFDMPNRQFPVGTAITLTCQGEIGSDPSKVIIYDLCLYKHRVKSSNNCSQIMAPKVPAYVPQRQCTIWYSLTGVEYEKS